MTESNFNSALLVLCDGTIFKGKAFGYRGTAFGEVVFNTGMTGYQEVLTDPSYFGQLVTFTYPEIGNTGINSDDYESSSPSVKGVIVRQVSPWASNWRSEKSLENWFLENQVVGISGIDTRALVKQLRNIGAMNGVICSSGKLTSSELIDELKKIPSMEGLNLADQVTSPVPYDWKKTCHVDFDKRLKPSGSSPCKVAAIDFGIKQSILERLVSHGCEIRIFPASSDLSAILDFQPHGVFLSNGPGDPAAVKGGIALVKELLKNKNLPIFGICLGHQILGLAVGGKTFKLAYGHRGLNHPCGTRGRLDITSQNHGFAIDPSSLPKEKVFISQLNLNDKTVAGLTFREQPVFGVQYHPEASPGPHDADHHFARFVSLMEEYR